MTNPVYIRIPFATSGDLSTISVTGSAAGPVNYTYGFGTDYSLPRDTDPAALNVERVKMNQVLNDVTSNIQQYQQYGTPWFITTSDNGGSPFAYSKNARVRYNNGTTIESYISLIDSNTDLPTVTASWIKVINDPASLSIANTFTSVQTISTSGIPLIINSTNSTAGKISLQDNGTQRGYIAATSTYSFAAYTSASVLCGGFDQSSNFLPNTANSFDLGSASFGWRNVNAVRLTLVGFGTIPTTGIYLGASNAVGVASQSQLAVLIYNPGSSVNYLQLIGSITGTNPGITVGGSDSNSGLDLYGKGSGTVNLLAGGGKSFIGNVYGGSGTPVNYVQSSGAGTGFPCFIEGTGTDSNVSIVIAAKGTGTIGFQTNGPVQTFASVQQFLITHTASSNRYIQVTGSNGGAPSMTTSAGDLAIGSASGIIQFMSSGSFSANGSVATSLGSVGPTGSNTTVQTWLTFKDSGGTTRYIPCF